MQKDNDENYRKCSLFNFGQFKKFSLNPRVTSKNIQQLGAFALKHISCRLPHFPSIVYWTLFYYKKKTGSGKAAPPPPPHSRGTVVGRNSHDVGVLLTGMV